MFDVLAQLEATNGLLTFPDVRNMLGVSDRTLKKMIAEKSIPSMLIAGRRKFCPSTLYRWLVKKCPEMAKGR